MQYLKHRLRDLNQIWHDVAKGLYLCSGWVLTSWPNPRWRPSRHLGFSITCNISNTAWVIWSKFGRTSQWIFTYVLRSFDLLTLSKMAAQSPFCIKHYMHYLEHRLRDLDQICTVSQRVFTYVLAKFWPLDQIQDGGPAAILDLAWHAISRTPLEWFEPNLARCHKRSLPMFWLSFDILN